MATYHGVRSASGIAHVYRDGEPLPINRSLQLCNHSPTGFEWGYPGSGPAQLALALLMQEISDVEAMGLHQQFKREFVSRFPWLGWSLLSDQIIAWLNGADLVVKRREVIEGIGDLKIKDGL